MKKFKNKISCIILIMLLAAMCIAPIGCKKADTANSTTSYLFNGYEGYYDLAWTSIHGNMFGKVTISDDADYITQGNASAKFDINFDDNFSSIDQNSAILKAATFKYETANYPETFKWLDKIKCFSIDIFNATDYEYDLYFAANGDEDSVFLSQGAVLAANRWNNLVFDVKPYFFDANTAVKQYQFYISGIEKTPDKKALLYVDNFKAEVYSKQPSAPKAATVPELNFGGIGILGFDKKSDTDFISTYSNTKSSEFLPLVYAEFDPSFKKADNKKGALKVKFDQSHKNGYLWDIGNGYDIKVHKSALSNVIGAKTISLTCFNPDFSGQYITLIAKSGKQTLSKKQFVAANSSADITLDGLTFDSVDELIIRIDSWKITDKNCLYFTDLRFTV